MNQPAISIDNEVIAACPGVRLGCLLVKVAVAPASPALLKHIGRQLESIDDRLAITDIHDIPPVQANRQAYKSLGKDPSRYRPSAEALLRRVVKGKGLYRVNNVVDALNLVSVNTGYSIGGYDADKVFGSINLGRGKEEEPYDAIGRGALNIAGLPVLRDYHGAFGSPTSDSSRTMVTDKTTRFLIVFFDFGKKAALPAAMNVLSELLGQYAAGDIVGEWIVEAK